MRWVWSAMALGCLTALVAMVIALTGPDAGPVLASRGSHGVHLYDLVAVLIWCGGAASCLLAAIWRD